MPKISKDAVDIYFEYGVDQTNRRIFLHDVIDEDSIRQVIKGIFLLQSINKEKPIEIYVGTLGGDTYEMFGLYDVIRSCESHIVTIGVGKVQSAGPLILAAGDERKAFKNTSFMVHESWYSVEVENVSSHEKLWKHSRYLEDKWARCMEDRTGTLAKKWVKLCKGPDYFFGVDKAMEFGIIDSIIT
jgi:ATP-dependent Clp protease protease subunit